MTDGPYNESIRGPGNRGLGGIWSLLNSIVGGINSLPQIAADIAIIRADLRRIVGASDSPSWPGLSSYLHQHIAQSDTPAFLNLPRIYADIRTISANVNLLPAYLTDGVPTGSNTPFLRTLRNDIALVKAAQQLELAAALQLASSIGNASTSTPNFTALAWLALIANSTERSADCCEEGSAPPPPANNPPPAGFCVPANAVRLVSWNAIGTQLVNGVVNNVFRPVFDFSGGVNAPLSGTGAAGAEPTAPALRFSANIDITFCISWDFAGNTPPTAFGRYFGINQATTEGNQDLAGPLNAPSTLTVGGLSDDRNTCDGIERYGAHNFAFPVGVTPSLNVFLGLTQSRGCAQ